MTSLAALCRPIDQYLSHFLSALLALLVLTVSWQVLTRYALSVPSSVTEELARFLLIWIGLLGAVHAYRQKMHLGIDLLTQKTSAQAQQRLHILVHALCAVFAVSIFIIGGGNLMLLTWDLGQISPSLGLPMAAIYAVLPLSGLLMCLYSAEAMLHPSTPTGAE
ncbi:TRAP transporter small permease [Simiduia sp. 21SJ11W-1]|uniref:TRAP transporter small permease n=1 Tax=Simiduia sp. 21SJ11W-1 TaxID=2909669 RepID=UPI00209E6C38|nr:TRAP transporter small permease [Simiduia sp. 21SJ11W-1]UTA48643.1 TRAP transporter small permease [Simiduia sp. 21SJ11W-1]